MNWYKKSQQETIIEKPISNGGTFYHGTTRQKVKEILVNGLQPRFEQRGVYNQGGPEPRIYLFTDVNTAEDGLVNWLADKLGGRWFSILEVKVNQTVFEDTELAGSVYVKEPISAQNIKVIKNL